MIFYTFFRFCVGFSAPWDERIGHFNRIKYERWTETKKNSDFPCNQSNLRERDRLKARTRLREWERDRNSHKTVPLSLTRSWSILAAFILRLMWHLWAIFFFERGIAPCMAPWKSSTAMIKPKSCSFDAAFELINAYFNTLYFCCWCCCDSCCCSNGFWYSVFRITSIHPS